MDLSDEGAAFIAEQEGTVKHGGRHVLYVDALGHTTIGIGHLVHEGPIDGSEPDEFQRGLTDAEAWELFRHDATGYVEAVDRLVTVDLTQRQFDALVDFAFNWGIGAEGGFPATSVLRLVNARDWPGVAHELVHGIGPKWWKHPDGRPYDKGLSGVHRRRELEAQAFLVTPRDVLLAVADDLRSQGIPVEFIAGWEARGRPYAFNPRGLTCHHTATRGYANDYPSLGIVRDGRSDLPGPLAQIGLGRITGTVYVIAAGYANHAGGGGWGGLTGNGSVWGIEAENDGIGEEWGPEITRSYLATATALARHGGFGPEMVHRHAEWSDGGKIDTATGPFNDGDWLRAQVAGRLATPATPTPAPEEEYTMMIGDAPANRGGGVWQSDGVFRKPVRTGDTWDQLGDDGERVAKHIGVFKTGTFDDLIDVEVVIQMLERLDRKPAAQVSVEVDDAAINAIATRVADILSSRLKS